MLVDAASIAGAAQRHNLDRGKPTAPWSPGQSREERPGEILRRLRRARKGVGSLAVPWIAGCLRDVPIPQETVLAGRGPAAQTQLGA